MTLRDPSDRTPFERVWECSSTSQIYTAAFEVHEAAMRHGLLPDEATTLSLSLAELATQAAKQGAGTARVEFEEDGWSLEVGPVSSAALEARLPMPLTSLRVSGQNAVARYVR